MTNWLVLGIGNLDRGDDGIGKRVVRALPPSLLGRCRVQENSGDASALLEAFSGCDGVVLVDAVQTGAEPGTVWAWDVSQQPLPVGAQCASTHALGVATAIELARTLGVLPRAAHVIGIEGSDFSPGSGVSQRVLASIDCAVARVQAIVDLIHFGSGAPNVHETVKTGEETPMHEMSLLTDLLRKINRVAHDNNAKRVCGVTIQLGPLAHISAEHLREHFVEAVKGTSADGADLHVIELTDESHPHAQSIVLLSVDVEE